MDPRKGGRLIFKRRNQNAYQNYEEKQAPKCFRKDFESMSDSEEQKGYYVVDGVEYPRVTRILQTIDKPGLARWRGRIGNDEADRVARDGAAIGTEFHAIVADINRGVHNQRGWQPPGHFREMAFAYIDWLHKYASSVDSVERLAVNEKDIYAGTLDALITFRGDKLPSVIDIKTSNYVSMDWPLQLSAYRKALATEGIETARRVIVRVPKIGQCKIEMYDYPDHEEDELMWDNVFRMWKWSKDDKERHKKALVISGLR
jgi:hypothetical protein